MSTVDDRAQTAPVPAVDSARAEPSKLRSALAEILQTVILTLVIFFLVRSVVQNFRVEGASMEPTLHTGEYLLINKAVYFRADGTPLEALVPADPTHPQGPHFLFSSPQRGDIIVFEAPGGTDRDFIKRVIGLPGEEVKIVHGKVYINGQPLNEPYLVHLATYDLEPRRVPEGNYFVLGDNRPNSSDSHLGWYVPVSSIIGKAWFSYWPPATWGPVEHSDVSQ